MVEILYFVGHLLDYLNVKRQYVLVMPGKKFYFHTETYILARGFFNFQLDLVHDHSLS